MLIRLENREVIIRRLEDSDDLFYKRAAAHRKKAKVNRAATAAFQVLSVRQSSASLTLGPLDDSEHWVVASEFAGPPPSSGAILFCNLETGLCEVRSRTSSSIGEFISYSSKQRAAG